MSRYFSPHRATRTVAALGTAAALVAIFALASVAPASAQTEPASVDLGLAKSASPAIVVPGGKVTYTLTVTNNGPGDSSGYTVEDAVPAVVTNVATATPGCAVEGNAVTCAGGPLAAGQSRTITITGTAPATDATSLANTASVAGNEPDPQSSNNQATSGSRTAFLGRLCRATAVRTGDLLVLNPGLMLGSASSAETPCRNDFQNVVDLNVPPLLQVRGLSALTLDQPLPSRNGAGASARVAYAKVNLLGSVIELGVVESHARGRINNDCTQGAKSWYSDVASLKINGRVVLAGHQPATIPLLGLGAIHINQTIRQGPVITQRAVFIDLPGTSLDIALAESKAGVACF